LLKISITMGAGELAGQSGDWWLVAGSSAGDFFYFDLTLNNWQAGLVPTFTGPLQSIPYFGLPTISGLPPGEFDIYFGFDPVPNGTLDLELVAYDHLRLTVQ
jgi:hypothetical protein